MHSSYFDDKKWKVNGQQKVVLKSVKVRDSKELLSPVSNELSLLFATHIVESALI